MRNPYKTLPSSTFYNTLLYSLVELERQLSSLRFTQSILTRLMDLDFFLQLFNAVFFCVLGSELFLHRSHLSRRGLQRFALVWCLPNLGVFGLRSLQVSAVNGNLYSWLLQDKPWASSLLLAILLAVASFAFFTAYLVRYNKSFGVLRQWLLAFVITTSLYWLLLQAISNRSEALEHITPIAFCVVFTYAGACFWDIRRQRPSIELLEFLLQFAVATVQTACMLPFVAVALSVAFLALISLSQILGISPRWLDAPIYYSVLYGPWTGVFFVVKRRCLYTRSGRKLLRDSELPS